MDPTSGTLNVASPSLIHDNPATALGEIAQRLDKFLHTAASQHSRLDALHVRCFGSTTTAAVPSVARAAESPVGAMDIIESLLSEIEELMSATDGVIEGLGELA